MQIENAEVEVMETPSDTPAAVTPEATPADPVDTPAEQPAQKPQSGLERRFAELTKARHDAEREANFWRSQVQQPTPQEPPAEAEPQPNDFDSYDDYIKAVSRWEAKQQVRDELRQEQDRAKQKQEETRRTERAQAWQDRIMQSAEKNPQIAEALFSQQFAQVRISPTMADAIQESDAGPEIAFYLHQHPDESARIAALGPVAAVREVLRIEAKLASNSEPPLVPEQSAAPEPVTPVTTSRTRVTKDPAQMSDKEFREWRRDQIRRRR